MELKDLTRDQISGREKIEGDLYLSSVTSLPEGFSPTVGGSLYLSSVTSLPEGFNPTVGGSLDLSSVTSLPEVFNPTVGGDLYLRSVTSLPEGFNPTVGGSLYLRSVTSLPEGFNPTVGGSLDLSSVTSLPEVFNPTVGGDLYLRSVTSLPEGFNPTVGGDLYLRSVTSLPEGFNPTVGGSLYLRSVTSLPEVFNPTVGGDLYLSGSCKSINNRSQRLAILEWQNGLYIKCDGRFSEVISKHGNCWKLKDVHKSAVYYLVTDGGGKFAHGETVQKAKDDLIFKISSRDKTAYANLAMDSELTFEECVTMYRVLTGACAAGVKHFVESNNIERRSYTLAEVLEKTGGSYGHEQLVAFFQ
jgi:hypothetical protein